MKLNTQIRLWQLFFSLIPFLSISVIKMTAFALPRRLWNAYLLFPISYFLPLLSINFTERKRRVGLVEMSRWGWGLACALARKEAFLEKRKCAVETGHRSAFWKKKLAGGTLMPHSSRKGLPPASAGWALYFYSVNSDEKLRMKMLDGHIMSNFRKSN